MAQWEVRLSMTSSLSTCYIEATLRRPRGI